MFLAVDDITVHVQQSGPADAEPLLLLHSLGTESAIWEAPAELLSDRFRIVRPDFRGHGLTGGTPGPYTVEGLARDVLALLDALSIRRAHVAGVSIGGMVAQALASQAPERVRSLVLVDTALSIPPTSTWLDRAAAVRAQGIAPLVEQVVARWVTPPSLQTAEAQGLRAMLRRTDPEGYAAAAEAVAAADLRRSAAAIRTPTLVLVGTGDLATPLSSAEALRDAIAGAELEVIFDAAHIPTMERPREVAEAMARFLDRLSARGAFGVQS